MEVYYDSFNTHYCLNLCGKAKHKVDLGSDALGSKHFHLRKGKSHLVHILGGTHGAFARHYLGDKFLLRKFCPMTLKGVTYTEKADAGEMLLAVCMASCSKVSAFRVLAASSLAGIFPISFSIRVRFPRASEPKSTLCFAFPQENV